MPEEIATPKETITSEDRSVLEFAKMKRQLALKEAELALAKNEGAESEFKCTLLQLYLKYGLLPEKDSMDERGNITRNKNQGEAK